MKTKINLKKILIVTFGILPLSLSTLACANTQINSSDENKNDDETRNVEESQFTSLDKFKIPTSNQPFDVEEEGLYILKDDFDGLFWNGKINSGTINTDLIIPLSGGITQLGKNDKIFFVFNDDDNDGIAPKDITKHLTLNDSSLIGQNIDAIFIGNNKKGKLKNWGVSQNNHMNLTFNVAVSKLKSQVTDEEFTSVAKYYGFLPEPINNIFVNDPNNPSTKSRDFVPVYGGDNFFSYNRTHQNAFEIVFNNPNDINISSAVFKIKNLLTNKYQISSQLALGNEDEWKAYELSRTMTYNFTTRKAPMYKYINDKLFNLTLPNEKTWPFITNSSVWTHLSICDKTFSRADIDIANTDVSYKVSFRENGVIKYVLESKLIDDIYNKFDFYEIKNENLHEKVEQVYWNASVPIP